MIRAMRARLARSVARSSVGVPPGTCCNEPTPQLSFRTRFLGRGIIRRYLTQNLSQSSDKVADRSLCRPGVFPKPPGSKGDEPSPAGTVLAPPAVSPAGVPEVSENLALQQVAMIFVKRVARSTAHNSARSLADARFFERRIIFEIACGAAAAFQIAFTLKKIRIG
jgi:hypothetical protein